MTTPTISSLRSSDKLAQKVGGGITCGCFVFAREVGFFLLLDLRREFVLFLRVDERVVFRF